jgi:hypothetical protein
MFWLMYLLIDVGESERTEVHSGGEDLVRVLWWTTPAVGEN